MTTTCLLPPSLLCSVSADEASVRPPTPGPAASSVAKAVAKHPGGGHPPPWPRGPCTLAGCRRPRAPLESNTVPHPEGRPGSAPGEVGSPCPGEAWALVGTWRKTRGGPAVSVPAEVSPCSDTPRRRARQFQVHGKTEALVPAGKGAGGLKPTLLDRRYGRGAQGVRRLVTPPAAQGPPAVRRGRGAHGSPSS